VRVERVLHGHHLRVALRRAARGEVQEHVLQARLPDGVPFDSRRVVGAESLQRFKHGRQVHRRGQFPGARRVFRVFRVGGAPRGDPLRLGERRVVRFRGTLDEPERASGSLNSTSLNSVGGFAVAESADARRAGRRLAHRRVEVEARFSSPRSDALFFFAFRARLGVHGEREVLPVRGPQVLRRAEAEHRAIHHDADAVAQRGDVLDGVRRHHARAVTRSRRVAYGLRDVLPGAGVDPRGGLVQQRQTVPPQTEQSHRQAQLAFVSAGERPRARLGKRAQAGGVHRASYAYISVRREKEVTARGGDEP